jgi:hypothetical protein
MIPKIVFTYWEGDQLSELHYLTIYSLHKYNPDIDIIIYTDENPKNILREWNSHEHSININKKIPLSNLININSNKIFLRTINFQKEYNFDNNISIVFKADFIRIAKLYEHGGIWFDMDILFIKPISEFFFKENVDAFIFIYSNVIPTGFLSTKPKSKYLEILFKKSLEIIENKKLNDYQKIGPTIWTKEYNNLSHRDKMGMKILDNNLVYPFLWNELDNLLSKPNITVPENTFGIHWYNGAPETKNFINNFNLLNINPNNSLIEKLIFKMNDFTSKIKEVKIEFKNADNLEEIQNKYYNKIMNINDNITVTFIIPEKLLRTKVFTFYKCWRNGYCLNDSNTKIPKNITKIILKKI